MGVTTSTLNFYLREFADRSLTINSGNHRYCIGIVRISKLGYCSMLSDRIPKLLVVMVALNTGIKSTSSSLSTNMYAHPESGGEGRNLL